MIGYLRTNRRETARPDALLHPPIKAVPNAPRSAVVGWLGDALKVKVHTPGLPPRA